MSNQFNFEQEKLVVDFSHRLKKASHTVSINANHGLMRFSLDYIRDNSLDGAHIKLYADIYKKAIGWTVVKTLPFTNRSQYRQLTKHVSLAKGAKTESVAYTISIKKLLTALGVEKGSYNKLQINNFKDGYLGDSISYVVVK